MASAGTGRRRRFWVWAPRDIAWLACAVQFAGTLWFNWSTGNAVRLNLSAEVADQRVWRPDALGSVAFLVASGLAWIDASRAGRGRTRDWWIGAANMLGSVAFGVSAVAAYVVPATGDVRNAELSNLGTLVGAICFLIGAILLLPRDCGDAPDPAPLSDERGSSSRPVSGHPIWTMTRHGDLRTVEHVSRQLEEWVMPDHYDVIVIGTGAGGGTLAHTLAASGKRILLLERGNFLPRETQNWEPEPVFVDGRYISPDTWYDADGTAFQPQVHYFVGGATKLYGAALYRLRPQDFGEIKHVDGDLAGLAGELRRVRAVVHEGGVALPGARQPR